MVLAAEKMNTERITVTDLLPIVGFKRMIHCEIINIDLKILMVHKKVGFQNLKLIQGVSKLDGLRFRFWTYVSGDHTRGCMPLKILTYGYAHA